MILVSSESTLLRNGVLELLNKVEMHLGRKLRVLDVGGGLNPWLGRFVTDVIDIDAQENVNHIQGDICVASTWDSISDKSFDFVNCTHTLEDVRDPQFVIQQMNRVAKSGFIAVPNRHAENATVQFIFQLGYAHHRWIFHIREENRLEAIAKFPILSQRQFGFQLFGKYLSKNLLHSRFARWIPYVPARKWFVASRVHAELGLLWAESLDFSYVNGDYAGRSPSDLTEVADTFLSSDSTEHPWSDSVHQVLLRYMA